jgi:hypothetical protein
MVRGCEDNLVPVVIMRSRWGRWLLDEWRMEEKYKKLNETQLDR